MYDIYYSSLSYTMKIITTHKKILGFYCVQKNNKYYVHIDLHNTPFGQIIKIDYYDSVYDEFELYRITMRKYVYCNNQHYFLVDQFDTEIKYYNYIELDYLFRLYFTFCQVELHRQIRTNTMFTLMWLVSIRKMCITCCFCNQQFNTLGSFCIHWKKLNKFKDIKNNVRMNMLICNIDKIHSNGITLNIPHVIKYDEFIKYIFYIKRIVFRDVANIIIDFLFEYNRDIYVW